MINEQVIRFSHDKTPRKFQKYLAQNITKENAICIPRQHGKSEFMNKLVEREAIYSPHKSPAIVIATPTLKQTKQLYWNRLLAYWKNNILVRPRVAEDCIYIDRPWMGDMVTIYFFGQAEGIRGVTNCILAVIDEAADMDIKKVKSVISPTLDEYDGKIVYIGTAKLGEFFELVHQYRRFREQGDKRFFSFMVPCWWLDVKTDEELIAKRKSSPPGVFEQEYECNPIAAREELVFGSTFNRLQKTRQLDRVLYDPKKPIHAVFDIGLNGCCIVMQMINDQLHFIDFIETWSHENKGVKHIIDELFGKGYKFGTIVLPWDALLRDAFTTHSVADQVKRQVKGLADVYVMPPGRKGKADQDRVNAIMNNVDRIRVDEVNCHQMVSHLTRLEYQQAPGGGYTDVIKKSRHKHCADTWGLAVQFANKDLLKMYNRPATNFGDFMDRKVKRYRLQRTLQPLVRVGRIR